MTVIVDTSVLSLAFRRPDTDDRSPIVDEFVDLVKRGKVAIVGPVRQEILTGIRSAAQFERLRGKLSAFPDLPVGTQDYEQAARFSNVCRANGVQGSNTDFLLCAVGFLRGLPIFTTDKDFDSYRRHLKIRLHKVPMRNHG